MASALTPALSPPTKPLAPAASPRLTFAQYMALEKTSDTKHHLLKGKIIPVAGASYEHNLVSSNLFGALLFALKGTSCRTMGSDLKVYISPDVGFYPDVLVHCAPPLLAFGEALQNPVLIAEVLSPSTEDFDTGDKFAQYQTIESLRHVLFLEQDTCFIRHYERNEAGTWVLRGDYDQLSQSIPLVIGDAAIALTLADIYQFVEFSA